MDKMPPDQSHTRASIFLRINSSDPVPRELAWAEFGQRYAPVIAGFARRLGVRPQDVDDIVQDVFLGFFAVSPKFVYDPSKGRFRGYLKTVTLNAIRTRAGRKIEVATVPLVDVPDDAEPLEQNWEQTWREQLLRRALIAVREESATQPKTFQAFEQYVLRNVPAAQVAANLDMSVDSVYQAKHRIAAALKLKLAELERDDG